MWLGLGAAVFTAAGLHFYSILLSRTRGHLARMTFYAGDGTGSVENKAMYYFGFMLVNLLTAVLIVEACFGRQSLVSKLLEMRWLIWVGSISYGLYLWHYLVFQGLDACGFNSTAIF